MDIDECRYVFDVLNMHRVLINSFNSLADKEGLAIEDVQFKGFDGNNETKRYRFAEHLKKLGRWQETLGGYLNSHSQATRTRYPAMLARFQPIQEQIASSPSSHTGNGLLTADQIKEVIMKA
jgi:hypothetical protein